MKNVFILTLSLLSLVFGTNTYAQSEESRTKIQMTINFKAKIIVTELNGLSFSLARNPDEIPAGKTSKDSLASKTYGYSQSSIYLTLDTKKISDELLSVFAKKQATFDGSITIVDTFGKNLTKTIKFKQASLYSYSDQVSTTAYSETYGAASLSFNAKEISINGITLEQ